MRRADDAMLLRQRDQETLLNAGIFRAPLLLSMTQHRSTGGKLFGVEYICS